MTKAYPPGRGLPPPLHIQRELVPRFFVVCQGVVSFGIKAASIKTSQTDINPKRTVL